MRRLAPLVVVAALSWSPPSAGQPAPAPPAPTPPAPAPPAPAGAPAPAPQALPAPAPPKGDGPGARIDVQIDAVDMPRRKNGLQQSIVRGGQQDRQSLLRLGAPSNQLAIGGYLDVLGAYQQEEGLSDGWSFEARRFNLFFNARIIDSVRLTSEIEFEHGSEEILLETAAIDILFHHAINLRAGILLTPIGRFNMAHDPPRYDVIDRPLVSTRIIPTTLSEMGAGFFGAFYPARGHQLTYQVYAVNGIGSGLIAAEGTRIDEGKSDEAFGEDENGRPSVVGRVSYETPRRGFAQGQFAMSAYAGIYNRFEIEGDAVDEARWMRIIALDGSLTLGPVLLQGEAAIAHVDLPPNLTSLHASDQAGVYVDATYSFLEGPLGPFDQASFGLVGRYDFIDLNMGNLEGGTVGAGDETHRMTLGGAFRPAPTTRLRVNYFHEWRHDTLNNPTRAGGVQLGLTTYF